MFPRIVRKVLQFTRRHTPEDSILHRNFHENPKYPQDKNKYKIYPSNNLVWGLYLHITHTHTHQPKILKDIKDKFKCYLSTFNP